MLALGALALLAGVATVTLAVSINEDGHYDTRYNHLDIERILNNKRLVTYYGKCLIGDGPCPPQGTEFKRILPEALRTNCVRCTEKQKVTAYLAIRRLKKEYPKIWQQLQVAWDPKGEYVSTFINTMESGTTPSAKFVVTGASSTSTVVPGVSSTFTFATGVGSTSTVATGVGSTFAVVPGVGSTSAVVPGVGSTSAVVSSVGSTSTVVRGASSTSSDATSASTGASSTSTVTTPQINGRFGESDAPADNEITDEAPAEVPLTRGIPPAVASSSTTTTTTTSTTTTTTTTPSTATSARPTYPYPPPAPTIDINYRTSLRPTRFNILLPRPQDFGRLTANWIGSIGDIGNKVIRTGARIADMVFSGVQAGVQATIGIGRPLQ